MVAVTRTATPGHAWFLVRLGTTGAAGTLSIQRPLWRTRDGNFLQRARAEVEGEPSGSDVEAAPAPERDREGGAGSGTIQGDGLQTDLSRVWGPRAPRGWVPGQSRRERPQGLYLCCTPGSGQFLQNGRGSLRGTQTLKPTAAGTGQARGQDEVCHHSDRGSQGGEEGPAAAAAAPGRGANSQARVAPCVPSSLLPPPDCTKTVIVLNVSTGRKPHWQARRRSEQQNYSEKHTYKQAFPSKGCREKRWRERERERSVKAQGTGPRHLKPGHALWGPSQPSRWRLPDPLTIQLSNP